MFYSGSIRFYINKTPEYLLFAPGCSCFRGFIHVAGPPKQSFGVTEADFMGCDSKGAFLGVDSLAIQIDGCELVAGNGNG